MRFTVLAWCSVLASAAVGAPVLASTPLLHARPLPARTTLKIGESFLANSAVAYRPREPSNGPFPLIVVLHGSSGYPPHFLQSLEPEAKRRGAILLAPHSLGRTWDVLMNAAAGRDPWTGRDTERLDQSLADLFSRAEIDRSRIVLLGFSDGASYALSLGPANPQLFSAVVAMSPGAAVMPGRAEPAQRMFVAHGRSDRILPFANTDRELVPALRQRGASVTFRPFAGDHAVDRMVLAEALEFALGLQAQPQTPTSKPK